MGSASLYAHFIIMRRICQYAGWKIADKTTPHCRRRNSGAAGRRRPITLQIKQFASSHVAVLPTSGTVKVCRRAGRIIKIKSFKFLSRKY